MSAIVNEWRVPADREQDFVEGWTRGTQSIRDHCGSFGSRLHRGDDGRWVAYARWPSLEAHDRCTPDLFPDLELMSEEIAGPATVVYRLEIVQDLLDEPRDTDESPLR